MGGLNSNEDLEQMQITVEKQTQDQKYSNFTMATVLSTAENIVWRVCDGSENGDILKDEYSKLEGYVEDKLIFDSYDSYQSGKTKPIDSLINQFLFQIDNFKDDYKAFKKMYDEYIFPDNISKNQILQILDIWINIIKKNNQNEINMYLKKLKNIIQDFPDTEPKEYENAIKKKIYSLDFNKAKVDPRILQQEYAKAIRVIEEKTADISHQNLEIWK